MISVFKYLKGLGGADMYQVNSGTYNTRLTPQGSSAVPFVRNNLYKKNICVDAALWLISLPVFFFKTSIGNGKFLWKEAPKRNVFVS